MLPAKAKAQCSGERDHHNLESRGRFNGFELSPTLSNFEVWEFFVVLAPSCWTPGCVSYEVSSIEKPCENLDRWKLLSPWWCPLWAMFPVVVVSSPPPLKPELFKDPEILLVLRLWRKALTAAWYSFGKFFKWPGTSTAVRDYQVKIIISKIKHLMHWIEEH